MTANDSAVEQTRRRVAIVTAASRGIGAACARQLAADGYHVALMARSEQVLAVAEEVNGFALRGDLTQPPDIARLIDAVGDRWGRLDVLVNNAGDPPRGDLLALPDAVWLDSFELLFMGALRLSRAAVPLLREAGGGAIVNISAADGLEPTLMFPIGGSMRAALSALTKLLARRLAADRIRVNSVLPWVVLDAASDWRSEEIPMSRAATHEEVARVAAFLCSPAGSYLTGVNLPIDGGWSRKL
jgi:NAD(P)-dependent dehydrogenase (short-subunit alcohol dehydrogenase family)